MQPFQRLNNSFCNKIFLSFLTVGFFCLLVLNQAISPSLLSITIDNQEPKQFNDKEQENLVINPNLPKSTDFLHGIGQSLNVTHNASQSLNNISFSWENGTNSIKEVTLGEDWIGSSQSGNFSSLTETRNWLNGSFHFGADDDNDSFVDNDTGWNGLDWNFACNEADYVWWGEPVYIWNNHSGNYNDSVAGRDCIELKMKGYNGSAYAENAFMYGPGGDKGNWTYEFSCPRGYLKDARIRFKANAWHTANLNNWEIRVYVDYVKVYGIGLYTLKEACGDWETWQDFDIPMSLWLNTSNVFPNRLDSKNHTFTISMVNVVYSGFWWNGTNTDFQQVFLDDIEFILETEVKPQQLNLTFNDELITSPNYGMFNISKTGNWQINSLKFNFTSVNNMSYQVKMIGDLNVESYQIFPTTNFETNPTSFGTYFFNNVSETLWDFYAYFKVTSGFTETQFEIKYPTEWTFLWISSSQDPDTNLTDLCDLLTPGRLKINIQSITLLPDGFWHFQAKSPNYFTNISLYQNTTNTPGPVDWLESNIFFPNNYLNITGILSNTIDLSSTQTIVLIQFPNGTIWQSNVKIVTVESTGYIPYPMLGIPDKGTDYVAGVYTVQLIWNNSKSGTPINATGMIQTTFMVKHYTKIITERNNIENFQEYSSQSLYFYHVDLISNDLINDSTVICYNLTNGLQTCNQIGPGYYMIEISAPPPTLSRGIILFVTNNTYYNQSRFEITISVVFEIQLNVKEFPSLETTKNKTFDLHLNYIKARTSEGITGKNFDISWIDAYSISDLANGSYIIHCNSSATMANRIYSLTINNNHNGFQNKSIILSISINPISTNITTIDFQQKYTINASENFTLRIFVQDLDFGSIIENCTVFFSWKYGSGQFIQMQTPGWYEYTFENVPEGSYIIYITIATDQNYQSKVVQYTLTAVKPSEPEDFPVYLMYIFIGILVALSGFFVLYQKVWRFPKTIRIIRDIKINLNKNKYPHYPLKTLSLAFSTQYLLESNKTDFESKGKIKENAAGLNEAITPSDQKQIETTLIAETKQIQKMNEQGKRKQKSIQPGKVENKDQNQSENKAKQLKAQIIKVEEQKRIVDQKAELQMKLKKLIDDVQKIEAKAGLEQNIAGLLDDLTKRFNKQKTQVDQLRSEVGNFSQLQKDANRVREIENKIRTIESDITHEKSFIPAKIEDSKVNVKDGIFTQELNALIQDLNKKIDQTQKSLEDVETQITNIRGAKR